MDDQADQAYSAFAKNFCARTKQLREMHRLTQEDMAGLLGIKLEAYKKYENRSVMVPRLMLKFCKAVGVEIADLFTRPTLQPPPPKRGRPSKSRKH